MSNTLRIRKSYKDLSPTQEQRFIEAIRILQTSKIGNSSLSTYDIYVDWHVKAMSKMVNGRGIKTLHIQDQFSCPGIENF